MSELEGRFGNMRDCGMFACTWCFQFDSSWRAS